MLKRLAMFVTTCCLVGALGLPHAFGDAQDDAFRKELKALAGTWRPIFGETDGNRLLKKA
jgi:hypothetical protein